MMLSQAFVAYARDLKHDPGGVIYVDAALRPFDNQPVWRATSNKSNFPNQPEKPS